MLLSAGTLVGPTEILSLLGSAADANMLFWLIAISELMSMRTIMIVPRRVFLDMSFLPCLVAYGR